MDLKRSPAAPGRLAAMLAATIAVPCAWGTDGMITSRAAHAADHAVVFMYHRFGEDRYPSTNISLAQFEAHLAELARGGYTVLPLPAIVDALRAGRALPDRTVGLSVDDAYLSVHREAWPRLRAARLPFTLFVATDPVDARTAGYLSWDQIREMTADGLVTIGAHTASHAHLVGLPAERIRREIELSHARYEVELGRRPALFAYPFGESSLAVQALAREAGYVAAFGQHSGVVHAGADFFDLPRFALNETYGDPARFRLAANALPLPASDMIPLDPLIGADNPPPIGFTVVGGVGGLDRLSCFSSHQGRARVERLGENRIEVRVNAPFVQGRNRVNCTLPGPEGRWRWWGRQFFVP